VAPRTGLDAVEKRKIPLSCLKSNNYFSAVQSVPIATELSWFKDFLVELINDTFLLQTSRAAILVFLMWPI
jgi:hypothetical protein